MNEVHRNQPTNSGMLDLFTKNPPKSMKKSRSTIATRFPKLREGVMELMAKFMQTATVLVRTKADKKIPKCSAPGCSRIMKYVMEPMMKGGITLIGMMSQTIFAKK